MIVELDSSKSKREHEAVRAFNEFKPFIGGTIFWSESKIDAGVVVLGICSKSNKSVEIDYRWDNNLDDLDNTWRAVRLVCAKWSTTWA